jgi:hypothetical protein
MCRLNARRRELVDGDRSRNHGAAVAMLAPGHRVLGGIGSVIRWYHERLPSRLGGTERTFVLAQMAESDRQEYQSGNDRDRTTKRRSKKNARDPLSSGFGHPGK